MPFNFPGFPGLPNMPGGGVNRSGPSTPPPIPQIANPRDYGNSFMGQAMGLAGQQANMIPPPPPPAPAPAPAPAPSPAPQLPPGVPSNGIIQTPWGPIDISHLVGGSAPSAPTPTPTPMAPPPRVTNGNIIQTPYGEVDLSTLNLGGLYGF